MEISSITLATRFGYGVRPGQPLPQSPTEILASLRAPDPLARQFSRPSIEERIKLAAELRAARKDERDGVSGAADRAGKVQRKGREWALEDTQGFFARAALSDHGFRERLVAFWADHFTVAATNQQTMLANGAYINEAIRQNLSGSFADILKAVVGHPAMLLYLDQISSVGPNSKVGLRRGRDVNENLAREVLELHTLGVDGTYSQTDVRNFAYLLTGLQIGERGTTFRVAIAEPTEVAILGKRYGGADREIGDIIAFLDDLAVHPETAAHIARKLAVHFVSETPNQGLVVALTRAFTDTGGDLMEIYKVLLEHPASATPERQKVKWPVEYMASSIRALNLGKVLVDASQKDLRNGVLLPLQAMGQDPFRPSGPDGWSEEAGDWITPPALAARIEWAVALAEEYGQDTDPRQLLTAVLGDVSAELQVAVTGAERKWEGVALLLVSPEFNRR